MNVQLSAALVKRNATDMMTLSSFYIGADYASIDQSRLVTK